MGVREGVRRGVDCMLGERSGWCGRVDELVGGCARVGGGGGLRFGGCAEDGLKGRGGWYFDSSNRRDLDAGEGCIGIGGAMFGDLRIKRRHFVGG